MSEDAMQEVPESGQSAIDSQIWATGDDRFIMEIDTQWRSLSWKSATLQLKTRGLSSQSTGGKPSEVELALAHAQNERWVDYAGPLCGMPAGYHEFKSGDKTTRALVTEGCGTMDRFRGDWSIIRRDIEQVLGDPMQVTVFHATMAGAVRNLYGGGFKPLPALLLMGEPGAGKSALQALVTVILGGRETAAGSWLKGNSFNAELFCAEHLRVEDDPPKDRHAQEVYTDRLRQIVACDTCLCQKKYATPVLLPVKWLLTISSNMNEGDLKAIPDLTQGIEDKISLLLCRKAEWVAEYSDLGGRERHREEWWAQAGAYIEWLMTEFVLPEELKDDRYHLKAWKNPVIEELARGATLEAELLSVLEVWRAAQVKCGINLDAAETTMTASHWVTVLSDEPLTKHILPFKFRMAGNFGKGMTEVARLYPGVVTVGKRTTHRAAIYSYHHGKYGDSKPCQV